MKKTLYTQMYIVQMYSTQKSDKLVQEHHRQCSVFQQKMG